MLKSNNVSSAIPLCKPFISQEEEKAAAEVLRSGWVMQGPKVEEFERLIAEYVGVKHAVAVNSGTSALMLAYGSAGLQRDDLAIMPSHTFVATANAAVQTGIAPVFVDIDPAHYNINPAMIASARKLKTRALVVVHQIGAAADMGSLTEIARKNKLVLVEDAACSLGATFNGRQTGSFGKTSILSFHPRKIITTGEGGMVLTDSDKIASGIRAMRSHGLIQNSIANGPSCVAAGMNYRMTDIQAAIGIVQFRKLPEILRLRRQLAERYEEAIAEIPQLQLPKWPEGSTSNYQSFVVQIVENGINRDDIVQFMNSNGINCVRGIKPVHQEPLYEGFASDDELPETVRAGRQSFFVPIYPGMTDSEQERVVQTLRKAVQNGTGKRGS